MLLTSEISGGEKIVRSGTHAWLGTAVTRLLRAIQKERLHRSRELRVVETMSVGKRQILLVQCGSERVLVGLGGDGSPSLLLLPDGKGSGE